MKPSIKKEKSVLSVEATVSRSVGQEEHFIDRKTRRMAEIAKKFPLPPRS